MSGEKESMDAIMAIRISERVRKAFISKSRRTGRGVSDVHRELVTAFAEDRVTIKRNPNRENIYVD